MENGDTDEEAAAITNSICEVALADAREQPEGPKLIAGDINASICTILALEDAIREEEYVNVGAIASAYGGWTMTGLVVLMQVPAAPPGITS